MHACHFGGDNLYSDGGWHGVPCVAVPPRRRVAPPSSTFSADCDSKSQQQQLCSLLRGTHPVAPWWGVAHEPQQPRGSHSHNHASSIS